MNKTKNVSPLRYPGGKTRACKIIDDIILKHFDVTQFDTLSSPFFGGGSFEFYFQNKYIAIEFSILFIFILYLLRNLFLIHISK